jgi:hypothetical protein
MAGDVDRSGASTVRGSRSWSRLIAPGLVVAAAASIALAIEFSAASAERTAAQRLPLAKLVKLARGTAAGLGDPNVSTALVVSTRRNQAENWLEPGAVPPTRANPRVYVIVLRGRFVCETCSVPPGGKPPRGHSAQIIWQPGRGATDFGLTQRRPRGLHKLGHVVRISLAAPR